MANAKDSTLTWMITALVITCTFTFLEFRDLTENIVIRINYLTIDHQPFRANSNYSPYDIEDVTLFNVTHFQFIRNLPNVCNMNHSSQSVIIVFTSPTNFERRDSIRQTWGSQNNKTPIIFLLGDTVHHHHIDEMIDLEWNMYGDMVQANFLDSYNNLTYKHIAALIWTTLYCPSAEFILKIDDDFFVNVPRYEKYIRKLIGKKDHQSKNLEDILCFTVGENYDVHRSKTMKWKVDFLQYPFRNYPNYCLGQAIVYSRQAIRKLLEAINHCEYFWIDDVYTTGFLAASQNIQVDQLPHTHKGNISRREHITNEMLLDFQKSIMGPGELSLNETYRLWGILKGQ